MSGMLESMARQIGDLVRRIARIEARSADLFLLPGISVSSSAPTGAKAGDLWMDTSTPSAPVFKWYNGSSWISS